eukprot:COSAG01_NODE_52828_length_343_cov_9.606557_2_plen_44_part_01
MFAIPILIVNLATLSRYKAKSLPYQRIYLMHGPPGNGKSSFLQA